MARGFTIAGYFLSGAIGASLLAWLPSVIPSTLPTVAVLFGVVVLAIALALCLDDWLIEVLKVERSTYYGTVIVAAIALLVGGGMTALCWL